jgi:hypothetical protein
MQPQNALIVTQQEDIQMQKLIVTHAIKRITPQQQIQIIAHPVFLQLVGIAILLIPDGSLQVLIMEVSLLH